MFLREFATAVKAVARSRLARPARSALYLSNGGGGPSNFLHQAFNLKNSIRNSPHASNALQYRSPTSSTSIRFASSVARPMTTSPPFLSRAPPIKPSTFHVGLGTARNFSTGRPVLQNIIENVPITTRALWEADWKVNKEKKERRRKLRAQAAAAAAAAPKKVKKTSALREIAPPTTFVESVSSPSEVESLSSSGISPSLFASEMDHFFRASFLVDHPVDTLLHIPLTPDDAVSGGNRRPLPSVDPFSDALALRQILRVHNDFSTHSAKVASLFSRLDNANVWEHPRVRCEFYRTRDQLDGFVVGDEALPSHVTVIFGGWTKESVMRILGHAGRGWCGIEEVRRDTEAESDFESHFDFVSNASAAMSVGHSVTDGMFESHMEFVMPTLDFSSSFIDQTVRTPYEMSDAESWA